MTKLYFYLDCRRPDREGKGKLKIALFHENQSAYYDLGVHLLKDEWDGNRVQVTGRPDKKFVNVEIRKTYSEFNVALNRVAKRGDFFMLTAKEVMDMIARNASGIEQPDDLDYVIPVYHEYIDGCRKPGTKQVYRSSLSNLILYVGEDKIDELRFKDINGAWLRKYQNWLLAPKDEKHPERGGNGMEVNGANVYLRNLRAIFNYAINNEFTRARYPFKDIDMSPADPDKREVPYDMFLAWATKPMNDSRNFYRDLFMLSFYLCGIRPIDLLFAKRADVRDGRLVYKPSKLNGRVTMSVKIEPEAWEIIKRYEGQEYLINIMETRADYKEFCKHWNIGIRTIGDDEFVTKRGRNGIVYTTVKHNGIASFMTVYYARSCFASYLYNVLDTPMDIISQALGHKSGLKVTNFYVKRDTAKVDIANRQLIDRLTADMAEYVEKHASA